MENSHPQFRNGFLIHVFFVVLLFQALFQECLVFKYYLNELKFLYSLPFSYAKLMASAGNRTETHSVVNGQLESLLIELGLVFAQPSKEM